MQTSLCKCERLMLIEGTITGLDVGLKNLVQIPHLPQHLLDGSEQKLMSERLL